MQTTEFSPAFVITPEQASMSPEEQLRPVVITVVLAKLAVFALLMTTFNLSIKPSMDVAPLEAYAIGDMQLAAAR